jgi:hypothetical protein
MDDIGLFEAIYSQRQITRYTPDPVPRDAARMILVRQPRGGGRGGWGRRRRPRLQAEEHASGGV